jgi:hypothetical protein
MASKKVFKGTGGVAQAVELLCYKQSPESKPQCHQKTNKNNNRFQILPPVICLLS